MTERENFLERWSRRKTEAQRDAVAQPDADISAKPPTEVEAQAAGAPEAGQQSPAAKDQRSPTAREEPAFDLASLPSLDSITATTDIRAFMAPGVPAELTRAALRRAWAADPTIRDFRGLQENDWDFNDPNGVPGFGNFAPGEDIKKLLAQVFGETEPEGGKRESLDQTAPAKAQSDPAANPEPPPPARQAAEGQVADTSTENSSAGIVQRNSIAALQDKSSEVEPPQPTLARKHGRALPQ